MTEQTGYITNDYAVFDQNAVVQDTIGVFDARTDIQAITVPIRVIFHTQMTDAWALQVVPSYDLTFYQKIDRNGSVKVPSYSRDALVGALGTMYQRGTDIKNHKGFNGTIGFALGSEFTIASTSIHGSW